MQGAGGGGICPGLSWEGVQSETCECDKQGVCVLFLDGDFNGLGHLLPTVMSL